MKRRGLTAPALDGDALVVGDFEGYLHWLDKATGEIVARQKTDGERITNPRSRPMRACSCRRTPASCSRSRADRSRSRRRTRCRRPTSAAPKPSRSRSAADWPIDAARHRARRSAQRRQVDAVQLPHRHARRAGRGSAGADARPQVRLRQESARFPIWSSTPAASSSMRAASKQLMAQQTLRAIEEADRVLFLVDAREGLHTVRSLHRADAAQARQDRSSLVANKAEGLDAASAGAEFHQLGLGEPQPISSTHGDGVRALMERALAGPRSTRRRPTAAGPRRHRVAVIGRPNVGKSTLINRLLGEERLIAFDQPGTTRDAVFVPFERDGRSYTLDRHRRRAAPRARRGGGREVQRHQGAAGRRFGQRRDRRHRRARHGRGAGCEPCSAWSPSAAAR